VPADTPIWTFAGLTAAVGMGVVFSALFLLSMYMHYFKSLISRVEGRHKPPPTAPSKPAKPPSVKPIPEPARPAGAPEAEVAAAVAVGLHLAGMRGAPADSSVAAAIAVALELYRGQSTQPFGPTPHASAGWKLAGRLEAMTSRLKRHDRSPSR